MPGCALSVVKKVLELARIISVRKTGSGLFLLGSPSLLTRKGNLGGDLKLVYVEDIVRQHWATYGRHYYTRYDYENVDAAATKELMANLVKLQSSLPEVNKIVKGICSDVANVSHADEFEYKDPVDGSVSKHQGIRYLFEDGPRLKEQPFGSTLNSTRRMPQKLAEIPRWICRWV
ncbi:PREDICTED: probable phosphoglucomutase, cytoplasmic 1 [Tarenaya hassleriana]|uniref:probable phosphoglucomutase, cytoplasmic 1 n=1 Tax=Tarenaya hassleriana TaxID=28532 RepID=UPI0008FD0606|nr:PREDICTED: probable phosphoglucomutase, cytoplasmic 1 [Tarenaya hassleriana]